MRGEGRGPGPGLPASLFPLPASPSVQTFGGAGLSNCWGHLLPTTLLRELKCRD